MSDQAPAPLTDSQRLVVIETLLHGIHKRDDDHEIRIRRLERWQLIATGLAGGVGGVLGQTLRSLVGGG